MIGMLVTDRHAWNHAYRHHNKLYETSSDSTCTLVCNMIFLISYYFWIIHINLCKDFFSESPFLNRAHKFV
jgi:hypothetical protein